MHGAEVSTSEVGSAQEFTKDSTNGHESREAEDAKENGAKPKEVPGSRAPRRRFTKEQLKSIYESFGGPMPPRIRNVSDIVLERAKVFNLLVREKEQF